jgi:UDP-N-acetylmuramoyl-L-alanyl-D-glutamate--2,6-diaminopimelate ligase
MNARMPLRELLAGIAVVPAADDIVVSGLSLDSRRVSAGDAFVALRGTREHGIAFAPAALAQGAVAVLADGNAGQDLCPRAAGEDARRAEGGAQDPSVPIICIENLRSHLGEIAARFFDRPSAALTVIGVTGTNGKTSTVQMLAHALAHLGHRAASIGTLGAGLVGALESGERTTPDVISTQALLARFRDAGASHVAMEVSSHALDQGRVDAVDFDIAVFTNLTRDHLDYHGSMQAYGAAKARLFAWPGLRTAVINIDDAFGRELAERLPPQVTRLRVGSSDAAADLVAGDVHAGAHGLDFALRTPWGKAHVHSPLLGRFNVANLLGVAACLGALGEPLSRIVEALEALQPVRGRMSRLGGEHDLPLLVVDYAHTPDALEQALTSLRAHCAGRLICVFGCGGERDAGKRPQMGAIAERLADLAIVTDDNPRGEDGDAIVAGILTGFARPQRALVERDRAVAIARALEHAGRGDVVLIAGKGHEDTQDVGGVKRPFDDMAVASAALEARAC